jgi:glycosyltransferase involved in cell wall biosynthesis
MPDVVSDQWRDAAYSASKQYSTGFSIFVVAHHPGEVCPKGDLLTPNDSICKVVPSPALCAPCVLKCKKRGLGIWSSPWRVALSIASKNWEEDLPKKPFLGCFRSCCCIFLGLLSDDCSVSASYPAKKMLRPFISPWIAMARSLVKAGAPYQKIKIINHGTHPIQHSTIKGLGQRPLRLGFIGRIDYAKGLHVLIKAIEDGRH